ncbi:MAG: hypothetical protein ACI9WU_001849 [Myxococcota bacterium]|jgi:hypothetical protein
MMRGLALGVVICCGLGACSGDEMVAPSPTTELLCTPLTTFCLAGDQWVCQPDGNVTL